MKLNQEQLRKQTEGIEVDDYSKKRFRSYEEYLQIKKEEQEKVIKQNEFIG